ncbi:hypothetical protein F4779DRAFT_189117 [Xylariaceae sp. FL0662B]|nr:hypothetical protein F4779DRAFT_189117 [Xylariaceae sp. FL0662B]
MAWCGITCVFPPFLLLYKICSSIRAMPSPPNHSCIGHPRCVYIPNRRARYHSCSEKEKKKTPPCNSINIIIFCHHLSTL